jgi:signal transduction histidine kinase
MNILIPEQASSNQDDYFEAGILRNGLIIAIGYQAVQILRDLITDAPQANFIINSLCFVLLVSIWIGAKQRQNTFALAALTHLILLPVFYYFWVHYNGPDGTVPYFIFLYFPFIVFTLKGALRFLLLGLYSLLVGYLMAFPALFKVHSFDITTPEEIIFASIDCFFAALLLSIFFIGVKTQFEKFRSQVTTRNEELKNLEINLATQNEQIERKKSEVEKLNHDLNTLIEQRTQEIEARNKMLSEYAFVNAHVLRGPMSRVLGLLNLMQLEPTAYPPEKIAAVQRTAKEMDLIIRKINEVLH